MIGHMSEILCPQCGHHIATIRTAQRPQKVVQIHAENDEQVQRFLNERTHTGGRQSTAEIINAYRGWCVENGIRPITGKAFGQAAGRLGIGGQRASGVRYYVGIHL